ncbi:MAG: adenylate/guanylate cyclase domain-containing protein [Actinomycetota bacterium]|nr:adenylate/guanylate cyclase domain-containing protein [Actinomycetota bacterium]
MSKTSMTVPDVQYARSGEVAIAYQVVGRGPVDLVFVRAYMGDLTTTWQQPLLVRHVEGLASFSRVLMLDKRGTGLSDRMREVPTLETRMDDVRAVMDAAGSERAVIWTGGEGARLAALFAATYPERVAGLVLLDPSAKGLLTPDYPWARAETEWRAWLAEIRARWGERGFFHELLRRWAPTVADDENFADWFVAHLRQSLSPGAALAFFRMDMDSDVADVLPAVRVPALVLHREGQRGPAGYFAERLPNARTVELSGLQDAFTWVDDEAHERTMRETERFVVGLAEPDVRQTVLATVLFTDVVGSTERAAALGDRAWGELLERHHSLVRTELARFRGEEVDTSGDGFLASFDGPARAIRCARAARDSLRALDLEIRAGIHTGECEVVGGSLGGIAVHIGARVVAAAGAGEVLVSSTVKDLVAGSDIEFEDRGVHVLKGVPGEWRLFAVVRA